MQCLFLPRAARDLEEIGDYIARDDPVRAVSFVREMRERCLRIAQHPHAGPLREDLGEGIRMIVFGKYVVLYRQQGDTVHIIRVLQGARDIAALFED